MLLRCSNCDKPMHSQITKSGIKFVLLLKTTDETTFKV